MHITIVKDCKYRKAFRLFNAEALLGTTGLQAKFKNGIRCLERKIVGSAGIRLEATHILLGLIVLLLWLCLLLGHTLGCTGSFHAPCVQVGNVFNLSVTLPFVAAYVEGYLQHLTFLELIYYTTTGIHELERCIIGKHHTGRALIG